MEMNSKSLKKTPQDLPESPSDLRSLMRNDLLVSPTSGMALGHVQTNLAILPADLAFDFLLFCNRNPKPCPIIEVIEAGKTEASITSPGSDIRTDVGLYRVYKFGKQIDEVTNISKYWQDNMVSFLLGCSFTFENALIEAGIELRHISQKCNVPMYITNIETIPAGLFSGPMVVSMRPIKRSKIVKTIQITSRFPSVHGAPIHIGDPKAIGINDLNAPDFGDTVEVKEDEIPTFWACGVTPQSVAMSSKPPLMITHSPGHMFITDHIDQDFAVN